MKHWIPIALVVLVSSSCYSRLTGNHGRFTFAYPASANVLDFNKPIAPGARLDVFVQPLSGDEELGIESAVSSNPDVIRVVEQRGAHVVLQGAAVGFAQLTIRTVDGLSDTVDLHVETPTEVTMSHACTDDAFAVYPADANVAIPFGLSRAEGQAVAGYGFWPIKVTPSKALVLDRSSRDQGALHFHSSGARHRVAIRSTIDDAILGLALATNDEVDGIAPDVFGLPWLIEGDQAFTGFVPSVGGVAFCQARVITRAKSLTPAICDATGNLNEDEPDDENRAGLVRLKAKKFGVCEFEVSFPEASGGQGIKTTARVPVGKFPSMDKAEQAAPVWLAPLLALIAPLLLLPLAIRKLRS